MKRTPILAVLALVLSNFASASTPDLAGFFGNWEGSWTGNGSVTSYTSSGIHQNDYNLDLTLNKTGDGTYSMTTQVSPMSGNVELKVTDFDIRGGALKIRREGDVFQDAVVLEVGEKNLSYISRVYSGGTYLDVTYRFELDGGTLTGNHQAQYLGQTVAEDQFSADKK
jgi:hypothetical protein